MMRREFEVFRWNSPFGSFGACGIRLHSFPSDEIYTAQFQDDNFSSTTVNEANPASSFFFDILLLLWIAIVMLFLYGIYLFLWSAQDFITSHSLSWLGNIRYTLTRNVILHFTAQSLPYEDLDGIFRNILPSPSVSTKTGWCQLKRKQWSSVHTSRETMCHLCVCCYGLVDALPTAETDQALNEFIRLHRHMFQLLSLHNRHTISLFLSFWRCRWPDHPESESELCVIKSLIVRYYVVTSCFFGVMISLYFVSWCLSSYSNLPRWRSIESGTPRMKNSPERYSRVS